MTTRITQLPQDITEPEDMTPEQQLMLMMLVLRGGKANDEQLIGDCAKWELEHGPPTYEKVKRWIADNKIGLDIGLALSKRVVGK